MDSVGIFFHAVVVTASACQPLPLVCVLGEMSRVAVLKREEIMREVSACEPTSAEWDSAKRALRQWNMEQNDEDCKLVLVLRKHKQRVYAGDVRKAIF